MTTCIAQQRLVSCGRGAATLIETTNPDTLYGIFGDAQ